MKIRMSLKNIENQETKSYELEYISYYYNSSYSTESDSTEISSTPASIGINCSIASTEVDTFLLRWMIQKKAVMAGEIMITDILTSETIRKFTFEGAKATHHSEGYSKDVSSQYNSEISITFKKINLNGVDLID
ncbi:type VI secretion system tube protein TssD [Bizionia sp.]|uniref:type VI secretion system tube protein TssD n=1 Tax=Bizionia sp. TaxID=1954480 RepID=UPI003A8FFA3B